MKNKPLNQIVFVLGEAVLMLVSGGVLFILISRLGGPELLGQYSLAIAWMMIFQGICSFGIPEFLIREIGTHGETAGRYMFHCLLIGLCTGVLASLAMPLVVQLFSYPEEMTRAITFASLGMVPIFVVTASRAGFMALRQMQWIFVAVLVEVCLLMTASTYILLTGRGVVALVAALVGTKVVSAMIAVVLLHRFVLKIPFSFDQVFLKQIIKPVFTFGLGNILGMLALRINTVMVSVWGNFTVVGHYAAANKLMEIALIVPNLFAQILMSRVSYTFNVVGDRNPNLFDAAYRLIFAFIIPACIGGMVFAGPIIELLFGTGFEGATWVFRLLLFYCMLETADTLTSVILKSAQRQRADVAWHTFNPLINIALNFILIPALGGVGAAASRTCGVLASLVLRNRVIAREMIAVNWFLIGLKPLAISVVVGTAAYFLIDSVNPLLLLVLYALVTALLLRILAGVSRSVLKEIMSLPTGK